MKPFINENFLLSNKTAKKLYSNYSENQPIVDFHCHLSPAMIAEDRQFDNLTQAWLEGDHYKWRSMRTNGINETYCTGSASDQEKYHWTHLELARYFNIFELLSPETAMGIYENASSLLRTKEFSTRSMIRKMNVEVICTTDDPIDSLEHHLKLKGSFEVTVLPTFRPDNVIKTDDPDRFKGYIKKLEQVTGVEIRNFEDLIKAMDERHRFFHETGGRHSIMRHLRHQKLIRF
jgi:glucuronate isomerase